MPKRKERTLKELYDVTEKIMEPEITPVLRGSCRIQGPVDETDQDIQKNTGSYRGEKRFGGHFVSERICKSAESGTCNVCSAPCSSCMHLNRTVSRMDLKAEDEFSDETSRGKAASRCSFNVADVQPPFKNRAWGDRQCAASETSNVVSASSSHESFCENAESKATLRTFDTSDASEDVEMLPKVVSGRTITEEQSPSKQESVRDPSSCLVGSDVVKRTFSNRLEEQRSLECHGDNISCVSGANDANNPGTDLSVVVDRKNKSSSSASVSSLLPKGLRKDVQVQTVPGCVVDIKCEVEENGKFRRPSLLTKEFLQNQNPTINSAKVGCLTKSGLQEYPSPKDLCAGNGPQEIPSPFSHSESGKSPCINSDAKDLEENSSPHHLDDPSECFTKHPESALPKLETSASIGAEKLAMRSCDDILPKFENSKVSLLSSPSGPSVKIYPCVDSEMDTDCGDSPAESMKCLDHIEKVEKSIASLEVPGVEEAPLHSQPVDDSDGSDIIEDVKVCDICGDAGREDLLAICSRCGDGAEHTYCMRIMVDKVPEGDWLCEECNIKEEAESQKQEKLEVGTSKVSCTNEKSNYESVLSPKLLPKIPDVDANRATPKVGSHSQFSTKRQLDSLDSVPAAKRQALDTGSGSPKPSSPGKRAKLVRESSFKNLDKGRLKAVHQLHSSGGPSTTTTTQNNPHSPSTSGPNSSRIPPRQVPRGTLSKSNSFTSFSKPKVKQIHDEYLKKPKSARDSAASETKREGLIRRFDKSPSFHSASSHSNSTVKNKLHSSNSGNEDLRGLKLAKERNFIERKNSFKTDRSIASSPKAGSGGATPKADQKAPRSETSLHPATNYRDIKTVQPNGRLSKPGSLLANRGLDIPKSLAVGGDLRRQPSCLSRGIPSPLSAMPSSADHKSTQVSPKDEPATSSLRPSDRPCSSPDPVLQDGLHQSQECMSQSRQTISPGDNSTRCHKCKETGHAAQFCPLGTSHISILEASSVRSSKEGPNKISKLKGAVEAVILRKAEAHKNIRMPGQSNELAMSSTDLNCEVAKDNPSTSSCLRSLTSVEVIRDGQDGLWSSSTDSSRSRPMTNVNTLHPSEAVCTPTEGDSDSLIFSNGNNLKPLQTESLSTASAVVGPLSILSIPEYDYIWQGGFEVRRSGRPMELYDGIQAHLSTCASPKVLEAMNKVPRNVLLEEVPRLSTWPSQFHTGATDDNIALYFFAKDFESYERNYKSLVENMTKNDLALKGYLDGVELLIFSSNQLPEKSQRWNMLFFLWGVFRGRKVNCSKQTYASQTKFCGADLNELPAMTDSQRDYSSGDAKDLSTICRSLNEHKAIKTTITVDLSCSSSSGKMDNHDCANLHSSDNPLGSVLGDNLSSRISTTDEQHAEMKGNNNSMDEQNAIGSKRVEPETRFGVIEQNNGLDNGNKVQVNLDNLNCIAASLPSTSSDCKETLPGSFKVLPVGTSSLTEEVGSVGRRVEENIRERSNGDAVILLDKIKEEEAMIGARTYLDGDLVKKEYDSLGFKSSRKRPCAVSGETFTGTSQSMPWTAKVDYIVVDEESEYKRMKSGYGEMCGSSSSSSRDQSSFSGRFPSQMHSHSSIFPIKEQRLDGSYDDMGVPEDSLTTERRFFPMDLGPVKDWRVGGNTIPLHVVSSDDEDQPESEFPNLELALGGEKKPSKQQGIPLFAAIDKKHDQEMLPDINLKAENREEDALASLSLSLAFPFSEERSVKSVSQAEAPLPERQPVDTSLILFGGFSDI